MTHISFTTIGWIFILGAIAEHGFPMLAVTALVALGWTLNELDRRA